MDTIRNYLDNMFMGYPQKNQILQAKEELLSMMEDKYNQLKEEGKTENEAVGIVISEFGNLQEVSAALGLDNETIKTKEEVKYIDPQEVTNYINDTNQYFPKVVLGISLCIVSVAVFLMFIAMYHLGYLNLSEDQSALLGLTIMFPIVAIGVYLIVTNTMQLSKYEHLNTERVYLDYSTQQRIVALKSKVTPNFKRALGISIMMYIMSIVPLFITIIVFGDNNDGATLSALSVIILIVALATYNLLKHYGPHNAVNKLLNDGEYSSKLDDRFDNDEERKSYNHRRDRIETIFWTLVIAVYLGYSLITSDWGRSWIVFPVAALLYAALDAFLDKE